MFEIDKSLRVVLKVRSVLGIKSCWGFAHSQEVRVRETFAQQEGVACYVGRLQVEDDGE
jgi:hypothetical protein